MRFQIFYTVGGEEDSFIAEGETIEEVQKKAIEGVEKRGGKDPYSVELQ